MTGTSFVDDWNIFRGTGSHTPGRLCLKPFALESEPVSAHNRNNQTDPNAAPNVLG